MTELPLVVTSVFLPLHHHKLKEQKRMVIQAAFFQGHFCLLSNRHLGVSGPFFPKILNFSVSLCHSHLVSKHFNYVFFHFFSLINIFVNIY